MQLVPRQAPGQQLGLPGRDLLFPKYAIHNKAAFEDSWNAAEGGISNHTMNTNLIHQNGLAEYDTHNLYGTMMSTQSHEAMLARRPGLRAMVITRSTFSGAGSKVGHWLGDNFSDWPHYQWSIRAMMAFASIYQIPMVGSDVCGYAEDTTEELCARWAMLGAFSPFYRNHNNYPPTISQEFYLWESVATAAKKAIDIRYRLLDYIYTALYQQTQDGTPLINPMFFAYPQDENTVGLDLQYFYGPAVLVAPVTEESATSVDVYLANDVYYDWYTHKRIQGKASQVTVSNQSLTDIPLFIKGGAILPLRVESTMTTTELRDKDFELIVALGANGKAQGQLYLDDGVSINQAAITLANFEYDRGTLSVTGTFGYQTTAKIAKITLLGLNPCKSKREIRVRGTEGLITERDQDSGAVIINVDKALTGNFTIQLEQS